MVEKRLDQWHVHKWTVTGPHVWGLSHVLAAAWEDGRVGTLLPGVTDSIPHSRHPAALSTCPKVSFKLYGRTVVIPILQVPDQLTFWSHLRQNCHAGSVCSLLRNSGCREEHPPGSKASLETEGLRQSLVSRPYFVAERQSVLICAAASVTVPIMAGRHRASGVR